MRTRSPKKTKKCPSHSRIMRKIVNQAAKDIAELEDKWFLDIVSKEITKLAKRFRKKKMEK